jgi:ribosomal protein S18 acetylase RimI-like enzyme
MRRHDTPLTSCGRKRRIAFAGVALEIRAARPDEFPVVADLCEAAYAELMPPGSGYRDVLRDVARRAADAELLVAADERVLGTVTFVPHGGPLGEIAASDETEFRMLAVDPAAQGRGIGAALLQRVIDASRALGRSGVVCSSLPEMRAAHRVYERAGFTRAPERDWSPAPGVDLIAFAIALAPVLEGGCECGAVRYRVADEFVYSQNCHCSRCRKATGSAFKPFAGIERAKLEVTRGEDRLERVGGELLHDTRCAACGSLLFSVVREGEWVHVAMGSLIDAPTIRPSGHIFVGSKAPWFEITDDLPQYERHVV